MDFEVTRGTRRKVDIQNPVHDVHGGRQRLSIDQYGDRELPFRLDAEARGDSRVAALVTEQADATVVGDSKPEPETAVRSPDWTGLESGHLCQGMGFEDALIGELAIAEHHPCELQQVFRGGVERA